MPIRTSGPWPGQEYKFSENYNTLATDQREESWLQQAGVWRFGINFDTTGIDFPFRWAVGRQEDLEKRIIDGKEQWYLLPGKSGQVSGCIVMDEKPPIGTTFWWGGLIHQSVEVANNNIDRVYRTSGCALGTADHDYNRTHHASPRCCYRRQLQHNLRCCATVCTASRLPSRYAGTGVAVWVVDNASS